METEVAGPRPDCSKVVDGALAEVFAAPQLRARLKPVFVTTFNRRSRVLDLASGAVVEASVDRGEIRSGDVSEAVCEFELELKSGPASQLFEFALKLLDGVPLRIENRSKAERGFALARGERPEPVKAETAALAADMTVSDAFGTIAWAALHHLQRNERGMLEGGDLEYLHQMRVALRRLRSAFRLFAAAVPAQTIEPLATEFKWLADQLGPARDWDVFMTETLPPIRQTFAGHPALARFARECGRRRRTARRRARRAVLSTRYQRLMLESAAWLAAEKWLVGSDEPARQALGRPATEFASNVLKERHAQVRKRGRKLRQRSAAELHRLRIAVKKLRYAADFFATLFDPKGVRGMLSHLARLQNILGAMNDAATVEALMRGAASAKSDKALSEARGIVLGWSHGRALTLRRELRAAWKAFRAVEKFW
jgi:inorganic triphosphatase YgiF